ncbi:hypothetical protein BH18ACT5_BH18ACT5_02850 [soil metagenome]
MDRAPGRSRVRVVGGVVPNNYYWRFAALMQGLAGAIYLLIGVLIVRLRPRVIIGWLIAAIGIGILMYQTAAEYAVRGLLIGPGSLPAAGVIGIISETVWIVPFAFIPILFLVYPTGKLLSRRWTPIAIIDVLGALIVVVVGLAVFWPYRNEGAAVVCCPSVMRSPGLLSGRCSRHRLRSGSAREPR